MDNNRQIDKKQTFQVRIDREWHKVLFRLRAEQNKTVGALIEESLARTYRRSRKK